MASMRGPLCLPQVRMESICVHLFVGLFAGTVHGCLNKNLPPNTEKALYLAAHGMCKL